MRPPPNDNPPPQRTLASPGRGADLPESDAVERAGLDQALNRSEAVKEKVEGVAEDLESTNQAVKDRISAGIPTLPARQSLHDGQRIESSVKEVAKDLDKVNEVLSQGIEQMDRTEAALVDVKQTLTRTEDALAESQRQEAISRHRAMHDALTGLPNRELFNDRLAQAIAMAERHAWTLAVLFLDLDRFKAINDEHGHAAGDAVLQETARRLSRLSRDEDTICRLGGDEFLVLLINPQGIGTANRLAHAIVKEISEPIEWGAISVSVATSIGIACFPEHATSEAELITYADAAMYAAKRAGVGVQLWRAGDLRSGNPHRRAVTTAASA